MNNNDLKVLARKGYYAPEAEAGLPTLSGLEKIHSVDILAKDEITHQRGDALTAV